MADRDFDLSKAVVLYLKRYPGKNEDEFYAHYGSTSDTAKSRVKSLLREVMEISPDSARSTLSEAGDYAESVIRARYRGLSAKAVEAIGNYYTYLMR
jgi:hypothetical protein